VNLGPFCDCTKHDANGPIYWNLCKSLCHEVASELVTTNPPDPHNWTLNSCFSVFRNVWVHLGPFCYCIKLGAKWAELVPLMQKFMPRSCVGTIHYEHTRNTPWDPKLMFFVAFRNVWVHLGPICYCTKLDANGPKGAINAKESCHKLDTYLFASNAPDTHNGTQNSCFVAFLNV